MVEFIYFLTGIVSEGLFLLFLIVGIAQFAIWFDNNFGITYYGKKRKLINDQMKETFRLYFINFDAESNVLTLNKKILKDLGRTELRNGLSNLRSIFFPFYSVYCYETKGEILAVFSSSFDELNLGLSLFK